MCVYFSMNMKRNTFSNSSNDINKNTRMKSKIVHPFYNIHLYKSVKQFLNEWYTHVLQQALYICLFKAQLFMGLKYWSNGRERMIDDQVRQKDINHIGHFEQNLTRLLQANYRWFTHFLQKSSVKYTLYLALTSCPL